MSDESLSKEKEQYPPDLFLAFKKRMTDRWQKRNERYLQKLKQESKHKGNESKLVNGVIKAL